MNIKPLVLMMAACIALIGMQGAYGAQLEAVINPEKDTATFDIKYLRNVKIDYEGGGQVAEMLRGNIWAVSESASTPDPEAVAIRNAINQKIASDGSITQITDMTIKYDVTMTGNQKAASIDYKIQIYGKLDGYLIGEERSSDANDKKLVDLGWRGMSINGPAILGSTDINLPISILEHNEPALTALMRGSGAEGLLQTPLIDAERIRESPLSQWHFLFDPTGISVDAARFGLADEIKGFVVSAFTMGESSFREGRLVEQILKETFTADRTYTVETTQSADSAELRIVGFVGLDLIDGLEIGGVTAQAPDDYITGGGGEFPVAIIYGMAGIAAVGGGAFFIFSNRQLKKEEGQGQTGIDPARLTGYQTSASAGGYQTNRGEAQLVDSSDYAQTRSVYDNASAPPAIPEQTSEASCGCAASADSGNECDCQMQGQCFCDATCGCGSQTCRDAVKEMA